jgi:hypothetical protein
MPKYRKPSNEELLKEDILERMVKAATLADVPGMRMSSKQRAAIAIKGGMKGFHRKHANPHLN